MVSRTHMRLTTIYNLVLEDQYPSFDFCILRHLCGVHTHMQVKLTLKKEIKNDTEKLGESQRNSIVLVEDFTFRGKN